MFRPAFNTFRTASAAKARPGEALSDDQLRRVAPSIFATEAHESRSARFAPVPTVTVLDGLRREGFEPVFAAQSGTHDDSRRDFTKHMLRLRHRGEGRAMKVGDSVFEIVLVNANDGSAAYQMLPGVFRLVCLNGLMVGNAYDEVKVRHSGNAVHDVIEGAFRVLSEAPRVAGQVEAFRGITLNRDEREAFAEAAHALRFEGETPIRAAQLLQPRRRDDVGADLWTTFNVAQENIIRGGLSAMGRNAAGQRRRTTSREVQGIDQNRALNRALWTLSERMAQLKAAA
jgi:hypothetical protein